MRENRPYGSEGGEGSTLPDPYQERDAVPTVGARHCLALVRHVDAAASGRRNASPLQERDAVPTVGARHCLALVRQLTLLHQGDAMRRSYKKGTQCLL